MSDNYKKYVKEDKLELGSVHYPEIVPFQTVEQVRKYLSGDRIFCLECGKKCRSLAAHLVKGHRMKADLYKEKYGIPFTYGLISFSQYLKYKEWLPSKEKMVEASKSLRNHRIVDLRICPTAVRVDIAAQITRDPESGRFKGREKKGTLRSSI